MPPKNRYFISPILIGGKLEEYIDQLNKHSPDWQKFKRGKYGAQMLHLVWAGIKAGNIQILQMPSYAPLFPLAPPVLPHRFTKEQVIEWREIRRWLLKHGHKFPEVPPWVSDQSSASVKSNSASADKHSKLPWIDIARNLGKEFRGSEKKLSQTQIAVKIRIRFEKMVKDGENQVKGRGGKIPSAETIRREALKGL